MDSETSRVGRGRIELSQAPSRVVSMRSRPPVWALGSVVAVNHFSFISHFSSFRQKRSIAIGGWLGECPRNSFSSDSDTFQAVHYCHVLMLMEGLTPSSRTVNPLLGLSCLCQTSQNQFHVAPSYPSVECECSMPPDADASPSHQVTNLPCLLPHPDLQDAFLSLSLSWLLCPVNPSTPLQLTGQHLTAATILRLPVVE